MDITIENGIAVITGESLNTSVTNGVMTLSGPGLSVELSGEIAVLRQGWVYAESDFIVVYYKFTDMGIDLESQCQIQEPFVGVISSYCDNFGDPPYLDHDQSSSVESFCLFIDMFKTDYPDQDIAVLLSAWWWDLLPENTNMTLRIVTYKGGSMQFITDWINSGGQKTSDNEYQYEVTVAKQCIGTAQDLATLNYSVSSNSYRLT